jgi:hypothetical protein
MAWRFWSQVGWSLGLVLSHRGSPEYADISVIRIEGSSAEHGMKGIE